MGWSLAVCTAPAARRMERRGAAVLTTGRPEVRGVPPAWVGGRWLIVWDGECGFCRRIVTAVLRRDRRGTLAEAPYQACGAWLPESIRLRAPEQVYLRSPDGEYWGGGDAAARVIGLLGHPLAERILGWPLMRGAFAMAYRWVARHRNLVSRWFPP